MRPTALRDLLGRLDAVADDSVAPRARIEAVLERITPVVHRKLDATTTDDELADEMVAAADVSAGDVVYDPCVGEGGLLLAAAGRADGPVTAFAQELDAETSAIARTRFLLAPLECSVGEPGRDSLSEDQFPDRRADVVVCDPPVASRASRSSLRLWLDHAMGHLDRGGRAVMAIPNYALSKFEASRRAPDEELVDRLGDLIAAGHVQQITFLRPDVRRDVPGPVTVWTFTEAGSRRRQSSCACNGTTAPSTPTSGRSRRRSSSPTSARSPRRCRARAAWPCASAETDGRNRCRTRVPRSQALRLRVAADQMFRSLLDPDHTGLPEQYALTVYVFDAVDQRLHPVWPAPTTSADHEAMSFEPGKGATGTAWERMTMVSVRGGAVHDAAYGLTPAQQEYFRSYHSVASTPIVLADGRPVGCLTAIGELDDRYFDEPGNSGRLRDLADVVAVVLDTVVADDDFEATVSIERFVDATEDAPPKVIHEDDVGSVIALEETPVGESMRRQHAYERSRQQVTTTSGQRATLREAKRG